LRDRFWQGKAWYLRDSSDPPPFPRKLPSLLSLFFGVNYLQHIALTMSSHHSNESEGESIKSLLKKLAQDFQELSYRQMQHETLPKERDTQFASIQDELKMVKERNEYNKSKRSSKSSSSRLIDTYDKKKF